MRKPSHTPGPWTIPHFARPEVNCECSYVLSDEHMGAVCTVHCSGEGEDWAAHGDNPKFAEACANARLIAAAPELLSELKQANAQMHMAAECIEAGRYDEALLHVSSLIRQRTAAIAKATGEQA